MVRARARDGQDPEHLCLPETSGRRQGRRGPPGREGRRLTPAMWGLLTPVALLAVGAMAQPASAQAQRLTGGQVTEKRAKATDAAPADFSGDDLRGLVLEGIDFK